jgi:SWI/SNF-related matrix-associated actin-dependent regulator 1 of chromatin subfamily A
MDDYNQVVKIAESFKSTVVCEKIPEWVLRYMRRVLSPISDDSCLEAIEPTLVESLVGFQKDGIKFGISRGGRCLIADDMGLGKTRQALAIADFFKDDWPLLVVTNASTRNFWESEIADLLPNVSMHYICVINSGSDPIDDAKIVICSYAALDNNFQKLMGKQFGMIIFDESHSLKNPRAKQTMNAQRLAEKAHRIVMITGTPALSRPVELFTQIEMLDKTFTSFKSFTLRYCAGRQGSFGWDATGSSHLDELNVVLRKQFMIRRIKSVVYSELGDKMREVVTLQNLDLTKRFSDGAEDLDMNEYAHKFDKERGKNQEGVLIQWYNATADIKAKAVW